jgi:hypothetical protein
MARDLHLRAVLGEETGYSAVRPRGKTILGITHQASGADHERLQISGIERSIFLQKAGNFLR